MREEDKFIDVEHLFRVKNPGLARFIPGFIFRLIRKIIHEEEINAFLFSTKGLTGLEFVSQVVEYFQVTCEIIGKDHLPANGKVVFAANHPLGGLEGILMTHILASQYGDVRVPVNDLLLSIKNFHPYFIPINKHGSTTREAFRVFDLAFATDQPVLMFPAGLVSRKNNGKVMDEAWKKTFLTKAIQHKRDIIPVFISGRNSNFFYNLAVLRKKFGIKANLEMFFLPNELFKQKGSHLKIYIGKPVPASLLEGQRHLSRLATDLQRYIYSLPDYPGKPFQLLTN
jgi:putative hemolysin